jgi:hypothetical protein
MSTRWVKRVDRSFSLQDAGTGAVKDKASSYERLDRVTSTGFCIQFATVYFTVCMG